MAAHPLSPRIVGMSVLSPLGLSREEFVDGLLDGRVGHPSPATGASDPPCVGYALDGFEPTRMLGSKGTRTLDRMTLMVIATTGMVLDEHKHTFGDKRDAVGLVLGTSTGSISSITDFTRDTFVQDKPYFVNPAAFPSTVINSAAGHTAIWYKLRGLNSTVSGGELTGLAALRYATRMIRRGYADTLLVGCVEELSAPVSWAAHRLRQVGDPAGEPRPLGEGCVVFLVDGAQNAAEQGRETLAEIVDFEFGIVSIAEGVAVQAALLATGIRRLLRRHAASPDDLWLISLAQGGDTERDAAERQVVDEICGGTEPPRRIVAARQVGSTYSALAGFQLAAVLATAEREGFADLRRLSLITALGADGAVGCALVRT
jgi:3-oxoacyl-[acyl-carrier-protein] synthase II